MTLRIVLAMMLAMALWVTATGPASAEPAPAAVAEDSGGQILVLLRLPPPHVRAGADYGGSYGDGAGRAARRRIAGALARAHGLKLVEDWPMPLLGVDCFVMTVPAGRSLAAVAATISSASGVAWSQPVNLYHTQGAPPAAGADPLFRAQPAALEWHLADLHRIANGRGVRVAVIDSAVERTHPDLAGQVPVAANFVADRADASEQHGTAVAGIIAALANNGVGIAGVAPGARLMALRACWQRRTAGTVCDSLSLAKAVHYAIDNGAKVINLSLGGPPDALLARLLDAALARGIVVVAAVDDDLPGGGFPASHPGVIAVSDVARSGVYVAPGRGVPTTQPGGTWFLVNGSSYSAAHVSGLFALLRGQQPRAPLRLVSMAGGAIDSCATLQGSRAGCPSPARAPPALRR